MSSRAFAGATKQWMCIILIQISDDTPCRQEGLYRNLTGTGVEQSSQLFHKRRFPGIKAVHRTGGSLRSLFNRFYRTLLARSLSSKCIENKAVAQEDYLEICKRPRVLPPGLCLAMNVTVNLNALADLAAQHAGQAQETGSEKHE